MQEKIPIFFAAGNSVEMFERIELSVDEWRQILTLKPSVLQGEVAQNHHSQVSALTSMLMVSTGAYAAARTSLTQRPSLIQGPGGRVSMM